jgi:hypothetical protein
LFGSFFFLTHLFRNVGTVFLEGVRKAGVRQPIAVDTTVLERLEYGHKVPRFYTLHLNLLLLQLQFPNLHGLPLLDITTVGADGRESSAQRAYKKSGGNNWPHVKVEGKSCCALQLMGLVQFKVIKRHPQEKGKKYINWGYERGVTRPDTLRPRCAHRSDKFRSRCTHHSGRRERVRNQKTGAKTKSNLTG